MCAVTIENVVFYEGIRVFIHCFENFLKKERVLEPPQQTAILGDCTTIITTVSPVATTTLTTRERVTKIGAQHQGKMDSWGLSD